MPHTGLFHKSADTVKSDDQDKVSAEVFKENFNKLRTAARTNEVAVVDTIRKSINASNYLDLLYAINEGFNGMAVIHYAASYNNPDIIHALVSDLDVEERLNIFKIKLNTSGCNSLHFASTTNNKNYTELSYDAAKIIKSLLYTNDQHKFWLTLLKDQQEDLDTAVHYAARLLSSPKLLELFSDGLLSSEWESVITIKNDSDMTAVDVYILKLSNLRSDSELIQNADIFIKGLRGPFTDEEWTTFLISNKIIENLLLLDRSESYLSLQDIFNKLTNGLSESLKDKFKFEKNTEVVSSSLRI